LCLTSKRSNIPQLFIFLLMNELDRFQKLKEEIELLEAECAELGESGSDSDDGGDAEEEDDQEVFVLGIR